MIIMAVHLLKEKHRKILKYELLNCNIQILRKDI